MELNLTPGALSHGIDALEQSLQVELFERKDAASSLLPPVVSTCPMSVRRWR